MKRKIMSFSLAVLMCAMTACDVKDKKEEKIKVRSKGPTEATETTETTEEPIPPIIEDQGEPMYEETTVESVAYYKWEEYVFDDDEYKYLVINDWGGYCHLIANVEDGWYEMVEEEYGPIYIAGEYEDRFYYADTYGLKYIDLTDPDHHVETWFEFEDLEDIYSYDMHRNISAMDIVGDTLYFSYDWTVEFGDEYYGLYSIKFTDDSLDDAVKISSEATMGDWYADAEKEVLYFIEWLDYGDEEVYRYDIKTGEYEVLLTDVTSLEKKDKYLICKYEEGAVFYDTETCECVYLPEVGEPHNGLTYGLADVANGDVYYKDGNNIVKYDYGKKTVVYTADGDDFYGFSFWTDGIIELIYLDSGDRFLVEGEEYKALDCIADFEVKMFDGSTMIFTIDQIYCLQVIYS